FFYRLGRFYENYYWETEQDSTIIFNAKKFFKVADDIWSSLPPETEGALKGFVKTSYGVYDPIYGFKLVKVEKGCFDMGIKESDSGYPEYFKKLEELRNALLMTEKLKVDDEGLLQVKNRFHMLEGEGSCHQKTIEEDFYIGMYPVTKSQWEKCACEFVLPSFIEMKKDGIENIRQYNKLPKKPPIEIGGRDSNCPMNYVSAYDADAFVEGLNKTDRLSKYALPTDAQWEYAARGGNNNTRTNYSGSDDIDIVANYGGKITGNEDTMLIGSGPCPVGSLKPNALGLYDMSGNVWEWCRDWYNSQWYKNIEGGFCPEEHAEVINFKQGNYSYSGPARVLRGGSWGEDALNCRVSDRTMNSLSDRVSTFGLRLVLTSPKKEEK
ncbi:MAG: formylglycine-generating enzyme family protein, partial [Bacteroidales bacterium]|nr:formylglycine-generating enzyme family protein [Bacteroidales bacterium]